ncbi:MAG: hypothetical protein KBT27_11425 [Prevotellaceae bacterium]|nr:hypothetical protein [Candidatus Faecinaster equi]
MNKVSLDSFAKRPDDMNSYLSSYGWHFNKKACEFAVSKMKKKSQSSGKPERIDPYSKDEVMDLLERHGIKLDNDVMYDSTFVANMCKADYLKSSVPDEAHLAMYIKDTIDDEDASDGTTMRRWYATMVANGEPVDWYSLL